MSTITVQNGRFNYNAVMRKIETATANPKSPRGLALRPLDTPDFDVWLQKLEDRRVTSNSADPLKVFVFGSSISSITVPRTYPLSRPWPLLMDILGSANATWRHAGQDADIICMNGGTTGSNAGSTVGTAAWALDLDPTEYVFQSVNCNYLHVVWTRAPGGGDIEVRTGAFGDTLIGTIDTDGTAKGGCTTDFTLTPNLNGRYFGNIWFVATGAKATLDGFVERNIGTDVQVVSGAHAGWTEALHISNVQNGLDYVEMNDPDCVIIMHGTNDGPANHEARLTTLVEAVQARTDNLVVIVGEGVTNLSATFTNDMSNMSRRVAQSHGCLFIDVNEALPNLNTLYSGDLLHPSAQGHQAIAHMVSSVLSGDPLGRSYNMGLKAVVDAYNANITPSITAFNGGVSVTTGDGKAYFRIPPRLNGKRLTSVGASVTAPSSSGVPNIQIARGRQAAASSAHSYVDMLSTPMTIDATEYDTANATTPAVINSTNSQVFTGDLIRIDVDTAGTGTQGLFVNLEFI